VYPDALFPQKVAYPLLVFNPFKVITSFEDRAHFLPLSNSISPAFLSVNSQRTDVLLLPFFPVFSRSEGAKNALGGPYLSVARTISAFFAAAELTWT
jgi:hypothetical protein